MWAEQKARDTRQQQEFDWQSSQQEQKREHKQTKQTKQSWWRTTEGSSYQQRDTRERADESPPVAPKCSSIRRAHLRTLGITPKEDTLPEIRKAYRGLARRLHPDKNPASDATELMKVANAAYEFLTKEDTE